MSTNFLSLRSTVTYLSSGIQPSAGSVYTVASNGAPAWVSTLTNPLRVSSILGSTLTTLSLSGNFVTINSTMTTSTLTSNNGAILLGNVGIGTTAPSDKLDVNGTISTRGGLGGTSGYITLTRSETNNNTGFIEWKNADATRMGYMGFGDSSVFYLNIEQARDLSIYTNAIERMRFTSGGNIGIGTTAPTNGVLHIGSTESWLLRLGRAGNAGNTSAALNETTSEYSINFSTWQDTSTDKIGARIVGINRAVYSGTPYLVQATDLAFYLNNASGGAGNGTVNSTSEVMRIRAGGNVGIGTSTPNAKLEIVENSSSTTNKSLILTNPYTFAFGSGKDIGTALSFYSRWQGDGLSDIVEMAQIHGRKEQDANFGDSYLSFTTRYTTDRNAGGVGILSEKMRISGNGMVGIGTTAPLGNLSIFHKPSYVNSDPEANSSKASHLNLTRIVPDGNRTLYQGQYAGRITFSGADYSWNPQKMGAEINTVVSGIDGNGASLDMCFATLTNTTDALPSEKMRITKSGNVGIGTTDPFNTLHLHGSMLRTNPIVYNTNTSGWFIIGYWNCAAAPAQGAKLTLRIQGCSGYDGSPSTRTGSEGSGETTIYLCNLNDFNANVANIDGSWKHEGGTVIFTTIKVVQNGANRSQYYIYAYSLSYTRHSINADTTLGTVFTPSFTSTTDPGANSSTVQLIPLIMGTISGNVGIGTTVPGARLQIEQGLNNDNNGIIITNSNYGSDQRMLLTMVNGGSGNFQSYAKIQGRTSGVSWDTPICLQTEGGRVGIGSTNPQTTFDVAGNILLSGTTSDRILYFLNYSPNIDGSSQGSGYTYQGATAYINIAGTINVTGRNGSVTQAYLGSNMAIQAGSIYSNDYNAAVNPLIKGGSLYLYGGNGPINGSTNNGSGSCNHRGGDVIIRGGLTNLGGVPGGGTSWVSSGDIRMNWVPSHTWVQGNSQPADQTALCVSGSTGYVGIGTASPASALHIYSTSLPMITLGRASAIYNQAQIIYNHVSDGSASNYGSLQMNSQGEILNWTAAGYVGIGTTNPATKLHIYNGNTALQTGYGIGFRADVAGYGTVGGSSIYASSLDALRFVGDLDSSTMRWFTFGHHTNNDITNTWNPKFKINSYNGSIAPSIDNTATCGTSGERWTTVYATSGVVSTSDSKEKDSQPLPYGMNEVLQMRTIKYKWKSQAQLPENDPTKNFEYYGFCADELRPLFPELVYDENPSAPIQMNYSEILPVVVNALKEEHSLTTSLKSKVEEQSSKIASLESSLSSLLAWAHAQGFSS